MMQPMAFRAVHEMPLFEENEGPTHPFCSISLKSIATHF